MEWGAGVGNDAQRDENTEAERRPELIHCCSLIHPVICSHPLTDCPSHAMHWFRC